MSSTPSSVAVETVSHFAVELSHDIERDIRALQSCDLLYTRLVQQRERECEIGSSVGANEVATMYSWQIETGGVFGLKIAQHCFDKFKQSVC